MKARCPECDTGFTAPRGGIVAPCPGCGNPVAIPDQPVPAPATTPRAVEAPVPQAGTPQIPWPLVGGIVLVLAAAHYLLYLLLTMDARQTVDAIEAEHGFAVTRAVRDPGADQPPATSPAYKEWHAARDLWVAHLKWSDNKDHTAFVAVGLWVSLGILLAITAFAVIRMQRRIGQMASRSRRRSS